MANLLGIDISHQSVRVALLRTGYRRLALEALKEVALADYPSTAEAVRAAAGPLWSRGESIATNLAGDRVFIRRVELPPTAAKQIAEVLPFELEAQLPFDLSECVFDSHQLPRSSQADPLMTLAVVARIQETRSQIDLVRAAVGQEPERVDPAGFALANFALYLPELTSQEPVAVVHLDDKLSDVVVLVGGQVHFARTISGGTAGLPEGAASLVRDMRQTLLAWRALGQPAPATLFLTGPGALMPGAEAYLGHELGLPIVMLGSPRFETVPATDFNKDDLPRYARAIGLALGLGSTKARGLNLRRGPLTYERGFGFLREKIPTLASLGALVLASFVFSTWMEARALKDQSEMLQEALSNATLSALGEAIRDPQVAIDRVNANRSALDDPMPRADAFDVMVQLSKAVPPDVVHDVEELDFQKEHATIHGIVPSIPDAQKIADSLKSVPCFKNVKIVRTNQAVNESRQKYVLELDVKCPVDGQEDSTKSAAKEASSSESPTGTEGKP